MADVQVEHGYTKIADAILEQLARVRLSPTQYRIIFIIWRYTYGFGRTEHNMSLSFLQEATGCDRRSIQRELTRLEERKFIIQNVNHGSSRYIKFNKNYDDWDSESVGRMTNSKEQTVGETTNGETTNSEGKSVGETANCDRTAIGETANSSVGETANSTVGETANQDKELYKELYRDISTTTSTTGKSETIMDVYQKVFNKLMMNGLMSEYIQTLLQSGRSESFVKELLYEVGESGSNPNLNFMKSIADRWIKEGITSRQEARERKRNGGQVNGQFDTRRTNHYPQHHADATAQATKEHVFAVIAGSGGHTEHDFDRFVRR